MSTSFGWEGKDRYGSFRCGWTRGVQVKLWDPLRTRAIPERLKVRSRRGAIQIHVYLYLYLPQKILTLPGCGTYNLLIFMLNAWLCAPYKLYASSSSSSFSSYYFWWSILIDSIVVWPAIQLLFFFFFFPGHAILQLHTNVFTYFAALLL